MRRAFAAACAGVVISGPALAAAAEWDKPGYELTFQDEFDAGSLDLSKWQRRYKWGEAVINNELQAYVDDAFVVQNGMLSIVGKHEAGQYAGQTLEYRSGVICSVHEQTYGYFEARVRVPKGQGYWPAFWLLGAVGTQGVNEIDVLELLGDDVTTAYMTVHWGTSYTTGHESDGTSFTGPDFSSDFHVFGVQWDPDRIAWSIDGSERFSHTGAGIPAVDMYVILNLAIGGSWPGAPDSTTTFPGNYDVDYVRAYRLSTTDGGAAGSAGAGSAGASSGGTGAGASGGTAGTSTGGTGTSSGGTAPTDSGSFGSGGSGATAGTAAASSSDDDSSCGCRVPAKTPPSRGFSAIALLVASALLLRRRRDASWRRKH
jgi:MYXO-CTERM domain-containing protein